MSISNHHSKTSHHNVLLIPDTNATLISDYLTFFYQQQSIKTLTLMIFFNDINQLNTCLMLLANSSVICNQLIQYKQNSCFTTKEVQLNITVICINFLYCQIPTSVKTTIARSYCITINMILCNESSHQTTTLQSICLVFCNNSSHQNITLLSKELIYPQYNS